ncbi:hypothetical protein TRFO_12437 [Tritrichomonas foetus]|uniref:Uncharacterized protein n=1 Tax=Tritrichomonas foetus TaxID=1144522 RepID=A0A1J4L1B0_9EUKA|nr:hypothetical protein TRFO_12437 [Tritrichomonas foetus]|eukprot:OHT17303.1 hypothetical protein TRFO_12437 [Tritrichomonas foetus]
MMMFCFLFSSVLSDVPSPLDPIISVQSLEVGTVYSYADGVKWLMNRFQADTKESMAFCKKMDYSVHSMSILYKFSMTIANNDPKGYKRQATRIALAVFFKKLDNGQYQIGAAKVTGRQRVRDIFPSITKDDTLLDQGQLNQVYDVINSICNDELNNVRDAISNHY